MKRTGIYFIGALVASAAVAFAFQNAAGLVAGHASALAKADGMSTRLIAVSAGGGRQQTSVDFAKPNLLRIDSATSLTVSDGKDIYTLYKGQNMYSKVAVSDAEIAKVLGSDLYLGVRPFFNAKALSGMTSMKAGAAVNRKGAELTPVTGNYADGKKATFYIGADGLARQIELSQTGDGKTESTIVDLADLMMVRPAASKFVFSPPAGAKEVDPNELTAAKWYYNLDEAKADAQRNNRPILVDMYTDWCHWCKVLDAEVFPTAEFKAKAAKFTLCKINPEKDPGGDQGFGVDGFPTTMFLNKNGQEIHRLVGYKPLDGYLAEMDKALAANR